LHHTAEDEGDAEELFGLPIRNRCLEALRAATVHDVNLQFIINCVLNGWLLNRSNIPARLRGYQQAQGALSIMDGLLVFENRIVVPQLCRDEILSKATQNARRTQIVVYGGQISKW